MQSVLGFLQSPTGMIVVAVLIGLFLYKQRSAGKFPFSPSAGGNGNGGSVNDVSGYYSSSSSSQETVDIADKSATQLNVENAVPQQIIGPVTTATQDEALPTGSIAPVVNVTTSTG